jgi:hypothetical protein
MTRLINLIPHNNRTTKTVVNEELQDMEVSLPSTMERFLNKTIDIIKSYKLPRKKEQLVIAKMVDALGMSPIELTQVVSKLKKYDIVHREGVNEATLVKSGKEDLRKTDLKKDDLIYFHTSENERGMSMYTGTVIGRVSKVIGSKNVEVTAIGPSSKKGDVYKVERAEALLLPRKGKKIGVVAGYNYGAGSGSQGTFDYEGVVTDVDLNTAALSIKGEGDKKTIKIQLKDIAKAFYL